MQTIDFGEWTPTVGERFAQLVFVPAFFICVIVVLVVATGYESVNWGRVISWFLVSSAISIIALTKTVPRCRARFKIVMEHSSRVKEHKKQSRKEQGRKKQQESYDETENTADSASENSRHSPKRGREHTWYETLGVSSTATLDQIRTAYREKIVQYHPDKVAKLGPELKELALRMSQKINSAYSQAKKLRQGSD